MQKSIFSVLFIAAALCGFSQDNNKSVLETAHSFQRQGDYQNAILVLNRGLEQQPNDLTILKEIAFTYYLQRDFLKAKQVQ